MAGQQAIDDEELVRFLGMGRVRGRDSGCERTR
jgi:hypothetical protein